MNVFTELGNVTTADRIEARQYTNRVSILLSFCFKDLFIIYLFYLFLAASGLSCGVEDLR